MRITSHSVLLLSQNLPSQVSQSHSQRICKADRLLPQQLGQNSSPEGNGLPSSSCTSHPGSPLRALNLWFCAGHYFCDFFLPLFSGLLGVSEFRLVECVQEEATVMRKKLPCFQDQKRCNDISLQPVPPRSGLKQLVIRANVIQLQILITQTGLQKENGRASGVLDSMPKCTLAIC